VRKKTAAVLGCGNMSTVVHLPILAAMPDVEIVALCDLRRESLAAAAQRFPSASAFTDASTFARETRADALLIIVPPQNLLDALRASLDVAQTALFVEKPLGFDYGEAKEIAALAGGELATFCGFNRRYWPGLGVLRSLLRDHGPLTHLEVTFFKHSEDREHWWTPAQSLVYSEMCHAIDLAIEVGGPVARSTFQTRAQNAGVTDLLIGIGTFGSGATWNLICNFGSGNQRSTVVAHVRGMRFELIDASRLTVFFGNKTQEFFDIGSDLPQFWREGYGYQWREFLRMIHEPPGERPRGFLRELQTMQLCAQALRGPELPPAR
jgi:predicted dehydrogenase